MYHLAAQHRNHRIPQQQRAAGPAGYPRGHPRDRGQVHQVRLQPRDHDRGHLQEGWQQHQHQQALVAV